MVASLVEVFSGMLLGRLRRPGVPPRGLRLVYRLARSPRLLLLELFASFRFRVAALLASCSVHPAPAWSPRGLRLRGCLKVVWLLVC